MKICQSCGMMLDSEEVKGINRDGSRSEEYCNYCYINGDFTQDITMDEMIEVNLNYLNEWEKSTGKNMTVEEARSQLKEFMPTLKRWSKEER